MVASEPVLSGRILARTARTAGSESARSSNARRIALA
jgi:hypothetical protein